MWKMTVSLRERRRQQTARDIQMATLELAVQHGLDKVTTEEIAELAGVSTRTFFNYYTNKEAAAVGAPPPFRETDKEALCAGVGTLAEDAKRFLDRYMEYLVRDEPIIRKIGGVLQSNEKARGILDGILMMQRRELTDCLCKRVHDRQAAGALASAMTGAIGRAIFLWNNEENLSLNAALDIVWDGLIEASNILASTWRD